MERGTAQPVLRRPRGKRDAPAMSDDLLCLLVGLVLEDDRSESAAARRLLEATQGDVDVLRELRSRVLRINASSGTSMDQRAETLLARAIQAGIDR